MNIKPFREKVADFWKSFSEEESQIREMMDNKIGGETLLSFVNNILETAFERVYFEMGMNPEGKYELILTPEGDRIKLLQLDYWLRMAPENLWEKWNFYSSKPGNPGSDFAIKMYGIDLSKQDVKLYCEPDEETKKININVYAPPLMVLGEDERYHMFFIFLDQYIGELYTMHYIGFIYFDEEEQDEPVVPVSELKKYIDTAIEENGWARYENPLETFSSYRMKPVQANEYALRKDIVTGYTSCIPLLDAYYNQDKELIENYRKEGVLFGYVFFDNTDIPQKEIVNFRGEIEDKIQAETEENKAADFIGGATGLQYSYIDYVIYDYEAFINSVKKIFSGYDLKEAGYCDFVINHEPVLF